MRPSRPSASNCVAAADEANARLQLIDHLLAEKELTMTDTVTEETVPALTAVYLRDTLPNYAAEGQLWARFMPALQEQGITPGQFGGCIEHDDEFRESDVDESVFLEVPARHHRPGSARGARRACSTGRGGHRHRPLRRGDPAGPRTHRRLRDRARAEPDARTVDDATTHHFNVYLDDPREVPEDRLRTKVYVPVA